jgi:hypothetical protein
MSNADDTFIGDKPLFAPGEAATPGDSMVLIQKGGSQVQQCIALTGQDRFEHMLLYCLTLLHKATRGDICAFYLDDFPDCDAVTLNVIQRLIGRSGYVTSAYQDGPNKEYKGFWAWRTVDAAAPAAKPAAQSPVAPPPMPPAAKQPFDSSTLPPTLPPGSLPPPLPPS